MAAGIYREVTDVRGNIAQLRWHNETGVVDSDAVLLENLTSMVEQVV